MLHGLIEQMSTTDATEILVLVKSTVSGSFWKDVFFEMIGRVVHLDILSVIHGADLVWTTRRLLAVDAVTCNDSVGFTLECNMDSFTDTSALVLSVVGSHDVVVVLCKKKMQDHKMPLLYI